MYDVRDTNVMQLSASMSHQTLQPKRTHDIQPIGGRRARPLSRAPASSGRQRETVAINVVIVTWLLSNVGLLICIEVNSVTSAGVI